MLQGAAHVSSASRIARMEAYQPPSYHRKGFGSQSCKPDWYDGSKDKKDIIMWEGDACGAPRVVPKKLGRKAPYNHSDDERMYRPTVPLSKEQLTTMVPALKADRQLVSRGGIRKDMTGAFVEHGVTEKFDRYTNMSAESKDIYLENKAKSIHTEMKSIIFAPHSQNESLPFSRTRSDFFKT